MDTNPIDRSADRIVPLGELNDFEVAEGDPDVRGWDVYSADNVKIGEVDELLIDTQAMKVRYLDVDVNLANLSAEDRHILIPIGYARLDESQDRILCDQFQSSQISSFPEFSGPLTSDFENSLRNHFLGDRSTSATSNQNLGTSSDTGTLGERTPGNTGFGASVFGAASTLKDEGSSQSLSSQEGSFVNQGLNRPEVDRTDLASTGIDHTGLGGSGLTGTGFGASTSPEGLSGQSEEYRAHSVDFPLSEGLDSDPYDHEIYNAERFYRRDASSYTSSEEAREASSVNDETLSEDALSRDSTFGRSNTDFPTRPLSDSDGRQNPLV